MTQQILGPSERPMQTQGGAGRGYYCHRDSRGRERSLRRTQSPLRQEPAGLTVVSLVGVNGTGKTTTAAKLAHVIQSRGQTALLAACDTFRAAAIRNRSSNGGRRLQVQVVAGAYGADPAAVAHDAVTAALSRKIDYLLIDTAGRLHTKHNLMQELQKVHRVPGRDSFPARPMKCCWCWMPASGMECAQARPENSTRLFRTDWVGSSTKLDGTSKARHGRWRFRRNLALPVKFVGLGEQPDDLQPFDPQAVCQPRSLQVMILVHPHTDVPSDRRMCSPATEDDIRFMRLALRLARRGYGATSPNPMVWSAAGKAGTDHREKAGTIEQANHTQKSKPPRTPNRNRANHYRLDVVCIARVLVARKAAHRLARSDQSSRDSPRGCRRNRSQSTPCRPGVSSFAARRDFPKLRRARSRSSRNSMRPSIIGSFIGAPFVTIKAAHDTRWQNRHRVREIEVDYQRASASLAQ